MSKAFVLVLAWYRTRDSQIEDAFEVPIIAEVPRASITVGQAFSVGQQAYIAVRYTSVVRFV